MWLIPVIPALPRLRQEDVYNLGEGYGGRRPTRQASQSYFILNSCVCHMCVGASRDQTETSEPQALSMVWLLGMERESSGKVASGVNC